MSTVLPVRWRKDCNGRYGGDLFGYALALHETEEVGEDDSGQEAARKTRCE